MNFLNEPIEVSSPITNLSSLCKENYFTMAENKYVNLYFLYILNGTCEEYKKTVVELTGESILSKDDFMGEIIKYRMNCGRKYNVSGIYSYRLNFNNNELENFMNNSDECFFSHSQVESIKFPDSIELFQHHNSIFVLLTSDQVKKTKRLASAMQNKRTLKNI
jgi:hypothetical protein